MDLCVNFQESIREARGRRPVHSLSARQSKREYNLQIQRGKRNLVLV